MMSQNPLESSCFIQVQSEQRGEPWRFCRMEEKGSSILHSYSACAHRISRESSLSFRFYFSYIFFLCNVFFSKNPLWPLALWSWKAIIFRAKRKCELMELITQVRAASKKVKIILVQKYIFGTKGPFTSYRNSLWSLLSLYIHTKPNGSRSIPFPSSRNFEVILTFAAFCQGWKWKQHAAVVAPSLYKRYAKGRGECIFINAGLERRTYYPIFSDTQYHPTIYFRGLSRPRSYYEGQPAIIMGWALRSQQKKGFRIRSIIRV